MPTITADKVVNHSMYANATVTAYRLPTDKPYQNYTSGQYIGDVFSWVNFPDGMYWQFMDNYNQPFYVKNEFGKLTLPALPDILAQIKKEQDAANQQSKGVLQYNIDKYAPYIIGAIVVAVALPTLMNELKRKK